MVACAPRIARTDFAAAGERIAGAGRNASCDARTWAEHGTAIGTRRTLRDWLALDYAFGRFGSKGFFLNLNETF